MAPRFLILPLLLAVAAYSAGLAASTIRKAYYSSYELEKQQRYVEASKALDPILQSYPQGYTVNYRKGWLAYCAGSFADAKKYYQVALTQYPSSLEVRKGMMLIDVARKSWKEVEEDCRIARKTDYYNLDFCYWQAVALRVQGQADAAAKVVEEITIIYPTNVNFLAELARIRVAQGKKDSAAALVESIFVLDPYNQEAAALQKQVSGK